MTRPDLTIYLFCVIGIIVSIVLPILRGLLPKPPAPVAAGTASGLTKFWIHAQPYLIVGLFSLLNRHSNRGLHVRDAQRLASGAARGLRVGFDVTKTDKAVTQAPRINS